MDLCTYLKPESTVWEVVLPFSFSSRLILVAAAESPINTAKIGSATLEMMYAGAGILDVESPCGCRCIILRINQRLSSNKAGEDVVGVLCSKQGGSWEPGE